MELIENKCHWCEIRITRVNEKLMWICDYESADCEFHPTAWDSETLRPTNVSAPHQTTREVEMIVREHQARTVMQRDKTQRLRAVDSNVNTIANKAQRTSRSSMTKVFPKTGSIRRKVYDLVKNNWGMTDYELEEALNMKHQTVSASRRSLVVDGHLVDSGQTKKNQQGNDCIVWVAQSNGMLWA